MPRPDGEQLYGLVEQYASFGDHRTATPVDHQTSEWFAGQLTDRVLDVSVQQVAVAHWRAESRLAVDGTDVGHLPLHGCWTGDIATDDVAVIAFDPMSGGFPSIVDAPIEQARASGATAAVLVTEHPEGSLVGVNRALDGAEPGFPVLLAAGHDLGRLQAGRVEVGLRASTTDGHTSMVLGRNDGEGPPILMTTPLTGWFTCAGERGTGIAVLLHLLEQFADHPLLVVAGGGHELGGIAPHHWVQHNRDVAPRCVVHVGASVAVDEPTTGGGRRLAGTRVAMTSLDPTSAAPIADALRDAELDLAATTDQWIGEAEIFSRLGAPMLSFSGAGIDFHTPEDTPERATSPGSLARVAGAIGDAVAVLIDSVSTS